MKKKKSPRRSKLRKPQASFNIERLEQRKLMASVGFEPAFHPQPVVQEVASPFQNESNQQNRFQDSNQRIVNGEQTDGFEAVGYVGPLGCTGTLISPTHVLTAAHCLEGVSNTGATFEVNGQTYQSASVTIHPDYNPNQFDAGNDVAIIELNRPVNGVEPMQINRTQPQVGTMLTLVGFGEGGTSQSGYDPNDTGKQVGQTELEEVTDTHISWNFDSHNEANTAPGDSGGPAFINVNGQLLIAGVTSGGNGDAHSLGDYSFDTRIDVHADWIDQIVGSDTGGDDPGGDPGGGTGQDDHTDSPGADATKINLNQNGLGTATGELEQAGDRDAFKFTVSQSGETTVLLTGTSNSLDTYLRLYDSGGNLIAQNDDSGGTFDSRLTRDLAAGTYYLTAGAYADDGTGEYRVNIEHQADDQGGGGNATFTNETPHYISDFGTDRVVSSIYVSGMNGHLTDLNVQVDIDHTWVSDLRMVLVAPDRTRIVLVNRQGDDGQNFDSTVFDQQASQHINNGDAPFRGSFRPANNLDRVIAKNPNGRWRLVVLDRADFDGGTLNSWSLEMTTDQSRSKRHLPEQMTAQPVVAPAPQRFASQSRSMQNDVPFIGPMPLELAASHSLADHATNENRFEQNLTPLSQHSANRMGIIDDVFSDPLFEGLFE